MHVDPKKLNKTTKKTIDNRLKQILGECGQIVAVRRWKELEEGGNKPGVGSYKGREQISKLKGQRRVPIPNN